VLTFLILRVFKFQIEVDAVYIAYGLKILTRSICAFETAAQ